MRRRAPRPLGAALAAVTSTAAPAGLLAGVQSGWREAVGDVVAAEAEPISERDGTVTVACRSAVWAQELELMEADLRGRLQARPEAAQLRSLRFIVGASQRP